MTRTFSTSPLSLNFKLFAAALCCALALAFAPAPAHAAGLTQTQIEAVLNLLVVFEVPQATVDNVRSILYGQSEGSVSVAEAPKVVAAAPVPSAPQVAAVAQTPAVDNSSLLAAAAQIPVVATTDSLNLIADHIMEINYALADVLSSYVALFSIDAPQTASAASAPAPMPVLEAASGGESVFMTLAYMPESLYETVGDATDFMAAVEMAPMYVISDALSDALFKAGLY